MIIPPPSSADAGRNSMRVMRGPCDSCAVGVAPTKAIDARTSVAKRMSIEVTSTEQMRCYMHAIATHAHGKMPVP